MLLYSYIAYRISDCVTIWQLHWKLDLFDAVCNAEDDFLPYLLTAHHWSIPEEKNEDVVQNCANEKTQVYAGSSHR